MELSIIDIPEVVKTTQFNQIQKENNMDITIYDLMSDKTELLLNSEIVAPFARVVRRPSHFDDTFDICLTVHAISVNSTNITFELPSRSFEFFNIPSDNYLKIEVM